jgi:hypothetical protein
MQPIDILSLIAKVREKVNNITLSKRYEETLIIQGAAQVENDSLKKLRGYAQAQLQFEELITQIEEFSKSIKEDYRSLTETILPELMDELGITNLSISEYHEIGISEKVSASIPKPKMNEACNYLEEHGSGSLIKREVTSKFNKEEGELAQKAIEAWEEIGIHAEVTRSVHHSTIAAWVRERLEEGHEIPFDLFGVFRRRASTIKEKSRS